ncbi:nucleotide disphospho-sugar-binding domain-containing protein [Streptomyces sp. NPDC002825]|uniref:glycosyltransferase n=1 Tax=Streptomyces sp. NPDC002825 TaxID=3154666 RepID=UPI0033173755
MRIFVISGGSRGAVFPLIPLATAARNAGHEVVVGVTENTLPTVASAGLPGVSLTSGTMPQFMYKDRAGVPLVEPEDPDEWNLFNGRGMGRLAAASLAALMEFIENWKPQLIIGGSLSYAAPMVAKHYGIPFVRQALNMGEPENIDLGAAAELAPELERLGLDGIPGEEMFIDICPPSVRPADRTAPSQSMRYVPYNTHQPLQPWMYTKPAVPRVIVSAGSRVTKDYELEALRSLVEKVTPLGYEMLIAVPDEVAGELGPLPEGSRAGWLPVDTLVRSSDLLVHRAGGNTMLSAMTAGIPQLVVPAMPKQVGMTQTLVEYGAAKMFVEGEDTPEAIVGACQELLTEPSYKRRSEDIAAEIAALPSPDDVVGLIEKLVRG